MNTYKGEFSKNEKVIMDELFEGFEFIKLEDNCYKALKVGYDIEADSLKLLAHTLLDLRLSKDDYYS